MPGGGAYVSQSPQRVIQRSLEGWRANTHTHTHHQTEASQKDLRPRQMRVRRGDSDSALTIFLCTMFGKFFCNVKNEFYKNSQSRFEFSSPRAFQWWSRNCRSPLDCSGNGFFWARIGRPIQLYFTSVRNLCYCYLQFDTKLTFFYCKGANTELNASICNMIYVTFL